MMRMVNLPNTSNNLANIRCISTSSSNKYNLLYRRLNKKKFIHLIKGDIVTNYDLVTLGTLAVNLISLFFTLEI